MQYTSQEFADHTSALGVRRSVGRTGVCWDNAQAESFNAAVKVERVNRTAYPRAPASWRCAQVDLVRVGLSRTTAGV